MESYLLKVSFTVDALKIEAVNLTMLGGPFAENHWKGHAQDAVL